MRTLHRVHEKAKARSPDIAMHLDTFQKKYRKMNHLSSLFGNLTPQDWLLDMHLGALGAVEKCDEHVEKLTHALSQLSGADPQSWPRITRSREKK